MCPDRASDLMEKTDIKQIDAEIHLITNHDKCIKW